jgi:hypothetical protein
MENQNSVKWGKPVEISGGGLTYTSKCGRFMITKRVEFTNRKGNRRNGLATYYTFTDSATGATQGVRTMAGGRKWAEHLAAQVA